MRQIVEGEGLEWQEEGDLPPVIATPPPQELSGADILAMQAAAFRGDEAEVRRIVESRGLEWTETPSMPVSKEHLRFGVVRGDDSMEITSTQTGTTLELPNCDVPLLVSILQDSGRPTTSPEAPCLVVFSLADVIGDTPLPDRMLVRRSQVDK